MKKSKDMCSGCRNIIYDSCWSYDKATVESKILVGSYESPPYSKSRCKPTLSCYYPQNMTVAIDCGSSGYTWKK